MFPLCSLYSDALGLLSHAYLDFPRSRERKAAVSRYRTFFAVFEIRSQNVLLRRFYIRPHVQEYLVGFDSVWEEHLTRWVLAVQNALRTDGALPPFPASEAAPPEGEEMEPGDTADQTTENLHIARDRNVTSLGHS